MTSEPSTHKRGTGGIALPCSRERMAEMHRPAAVREHERAERHKRWIAELSDRDWTRIRALARQVTPEYVPARLDDLDARGLAVGVAWAGAETRTSGERIGSLRDGKVAVLVWEK
jgi:hypothetical protein